MLKIWGRTNSINVQKVLWCCAELGLAYERVDAGGQFGVVDSAEYRALNPNGLVPTIEDDGFVLWESNVIVRYLCHLHSHGTLCPTNIRERFTAEKWMEWQGGMMNGAMRDAFLGIVRTPPEKRDEAAIEASKAKTAGLMAALEAQLGTTAYLAGERFTMGDIPVAASIYRCFALGIGGDGFPNLRRWHGAIAERPGFQEHVALPLT